MGFYGALFAIAECWQKWGIGLWGWKRVEGGVGVKVFVNGVKRMLIIKMP